MPTLSVPTFVYASSIRKACSPKWVSAFQEVINSQGNNQGLEQNAKVGLRPLLQLEKRRARASLSHGSE